MLDKLLKKELNKIGIQKENKEFWIDLMKKAGL